MLLSMHKIRDFSLWLRAKCVDNVRNIGNFILYVYSKLKLAYNDHAMAISV